MNERLCCKEPEGVSIDFEEHFEDPSDFVLVNHPVAVLVNQRNHFLLPLLNVALQLLLLRFVLQVFI